MPSNTTLNSGSGGAELVTKQRSHDGDTSQQQGVFLSGVTGSEDSYTFTDITAGNGTASSALRVTIASDTTGVLSIDDNSSSITVDNAGTFAVQVDGDALTALQLIDDVIYADDAAFMTGTSKVAAVGAVFDDTTPDSVDEGDVGAVRMSANRNLYVNIRDDAGNERGLNVDSNGDIGVTNAALTELAAAINASELDVNLASSNATVTVDLGANNDVTIDGSSIVLAEDAVHNSGDAGVMALAVQQTSDGALAGTTGDYAPLQVDDNGYLKVNIKAGAGSGGTASTDDGAFTAGSGSGTPAMGFFSTDTVDANDVGVLAMDASRRLLVSIEADNVGIGGGTQYTEDDAAPANPVGNALVAERDDALGGLTPAEGDWTHLYTDANGALWTAINNTVTVSGTVTADAGTNLNTSALALESGGNLATLAGAVSGSEMQVDIVADGADLLTNTNFAAAFGTAGSADTQVMSVQGIASMTPILADVTGQGDVPITLDGESVAVTNSDITTIELNTSGNTSHYRNIDASTEAAIKASAGTLKWLHAMNMTASVAYIHLYDDTTGNVTPGSTTPDYTFPLATQGDTNGAGFVLPAAIEFSTAITIVVTTTLDGSAGDPGTNGVIVNAGYT